MALHSGRALRRRRIPVLSACGTLAAALLVAGCGPGAPAGSGGSDAGNRPGSGHSAGMGPVTGQSAAAGGGPITLAFAGDVHFSGRTATLLGDPASAFGPITDVLSSADFAMVNLETAVTDKGTPEPKEFHFRAPASTFEALRSGGVDLVTAANNHSLDYGRVGLSDTIANAKAANFPVIGIGADATQAYAPYIADVKGTKVAFVAMSQVHELESTWKATDTRSGEAMASDLTRSAAAVRAARQQADVVIVYVHWGHEGSGCPTGEMRTFAKAMATAGADVVLGTHAHLLLGDGWIGKTYIQYGMGNFLWWYDDAFSNDTGVVQVTITDKKISGTRFVPAEISRTTGQPIPATGTEATRIAAKYAQLRGCTGLAAAPSSG